MRSINEPQFMKIKLLEDPSHVDVCFMNFVCPDKQRTALFVTRWIHMYAVTISVLMILKSLLLLSDPFCSVVCFFSGSCALLHVYSYILDH